MPPAPSIDLGPAVVISHASSTVAGPRHNALHVLATRACRSTSTHCDRFTFRKDIYMDAKFTELVEQLNGSILRYVRQRLPAHLGQDHR